MPVTKTPFIWNNGGFIPWDDARIHVLSHVINYGSGLFEGIRCYATPHGPAIFRLPDHLQRLLHSAKIYRMEMRFSRSQLEQACIELIQRNNMQSAYLRPIVLRGEGGMGVLPTDNPVDVYIAAWEWGRYLGPEAQEKGVDVCISSWRRFAPGAVPAMAKAASNYMNSQLIKMEAVANGFVEGIALDASGFVSEGSGENVFMVREGILYTPPVSASILPGITRDCVITIAESLGMQVRQENIPREALYIADELFFTGTAVEVTAIRSVDHIPVGSGVRGPVTRAIQERYFAIAQGQQPDAWNWRTAVPQLTGAIR